MTNPQFQSLKEEAGEVNIILVPHAEGWVKGREGAQGGSTGDGLSLPHSLVRWPVSLSSLNRGISQGHKEANVLRKGEMIQYETTLA